MFGFKEKKCGFTIYQELKDIYVILRLKVGILAKQICYFDLDEIHHNSPTSNVWSIWGGSPFQQEKLGSVGGPLTS